MNKLKRYSAAAALCAAMMLTACGGKENPDSAPVFESVDNKTASQQEAPDMPTEQKTAADNKPDVLSEEQVLGAVKNYYKTQNPGSEGENSDGEYTEYWEVSTNDAGEIVVLYRSYTAAQIRYYVNAASGETYVTELVPGIIDEEQRTDEAFNVKDYLEANGQQDKNDSSPVPTENETADGFMGAYLQSSDKDKIDTTNEAGVFYKIVYDASIDGDELIVYGAMDYRNSKDQDAMTISSDIKHVFKVNDKTVYQMVGGETGADEVSKEEFSDYLKNLIDSGLFLDVEVSGGVVATASINS